MDEYIEPSPRARLIGIVLAAVVFVFGLALTLWIQPALSDCFGSLPLCEKLHWSRKFMRALPWALSLPALWLLCFGARVILSGQSPPPGAWVWRRTRIRRGWTVRWGTTAAAAMLVTVLYLSFGSWVPMQQMVDEAIASECAQAG